MRICSSCKKRKSKTHIEYKWARISIKLSTLARLRSAWSAVGKALNYIKNREKGYSKRVLQK